MAAGSGVMPISTMPGRAEVPGVKLSQSSGGAMLSDGARAGRCGQVGGVERVGEEGVLDVGGGELEVLLLVLEAEGDAAEGFVFGRVGEEALDGGVDVAAVGEDLVERRAGEGGAELLFGHLAEGACSSC